MKQPDQTGYYKGKPHWAYYDEIPILLNSNKLDEAEELLLGLLDAIESEAKSQRSGVPAYCYERLAMVYQRKRDRFSELKALERYANQTRAPGGPAKLLMKRLSLLQNSNGLEPTQGSDNQDERTGLEPTM